MKRRSALPRATTASSLVLALASFLWLTTPAHPESRPQALAAELALVRYVAPGGACLGPTPCYPTIQAAVDASQLGDVIRIAAGTYSDMHSRAGSSQVVHITKSITLRGGFSVANGFAWPPHPDTNRTILDAKGQGRVIVVQGAGPTLEGLVITGGAGYFSGGGLYSEDGSTVVRNCEIMTNAANGDGGGVFVNRGSVRIEDSQIADNQATWSGGLRIINNADAILLGNRVARNVAQIAGGGIDVECCGGTRPLIARNLILDNQGGQRGGGLAVSSTNAEVVNNIIAGNEATQGAGIWLNGTAGYPADVALKHNTLVGSAAATEGVWVGDHVSAALTNNIVSGFAMGISNTSPADATVIARNTLFYGNGSDYGTGVTSSAEVKGNPAFVNAGAVDYHIARPSAGLDRGRDAGVSEDIDGQHRPVGAAPDIGADEVACPTYLPLAIRRH